MKDSIFFKYIIIFLLIGVIVSSRYLDFSHFQYYKTTGVANLFGKRLLLTANPDILKNNSLSKKAKNNSNNIPLITSQIPISAINKPPVFDTMQIKLKNTILLENIPFVVQAPFANWRIHHESCEEASVLMIHNYLTGYKEIDMKVIDLTLRKMKEFQIERNGEEKDLHKEELVNFIKDFFNYKKVNLYYNSTIKNIKEKLAHGTPVIIPVKAKILSNPYYREADYHVLVVIGYDDNTQKIITNDPGTIRGQRYTYPYSVFESAMIKAGGNIITIEDSRISN